MAQYQEVALSSTPKARGRRSKNAPVRRSDPDIDEGLKLAARLFPVFAGTGPLILHVAMSKLGSTIAFDTLKREIRLTGIRFRGSVRVPLPEVMGSGR